MTLRKFFRFFKHFGYYMRKDWKWLKNKMRTHKIEKQKCKIKNNLDVQLAKFKTALERVIKTRKTKEFVYMRNAYYVIDQSKPYMWTKIYRENDVWYITDGFSTKKFVVGNPYGMKSHPGTELINSMFVKQPSIVDRFTVLISDLTSISVLDDSKDDMNSYRIYHLYGKQRPRLGYAIEWHKDSWMVTVHDSIRKCVYDLNLKYDPQIIMDKLMARNPK